MVTINYILLCITIIIFRRVLTGIFVVPTICDLIGTTLSGIGLLYVPASVWQMLRGAIIIFAGILSVRCCFVSLVITKMKFIMLPQ